MTTVYQKYEQKGLKFLTDFKTTDEMFKRSKRKYIEGSIKTARRKYVNEQIEQIEKRIMLKWTQKWTRLFLESIRVEVSTCRKVDASKRLLVEK